MSISKLSQHLKPSSLITAVAKEFPDLLLHWFYNVGVTIVSQHQESIFSLRMELYSLNPTGCQVKWVIFSQLLENKIVNKDDNPMLNTTTASHSGSHCLLHTDHTDQNL